MSRFSSAVSTGPRNRTLFFACLLLLAFVFLPFFARSENAPPAPLSLDVPFVPTPPDVVDKMLRMADVRSSDFLIDLGAGDGRIAVAAVRDYGAKGAFGVDLNPERVKEARANAQQAGVDDRVHFEVQDLFETDFSKATVVSMYLLPSVNMKLRPKVLDLMPGTRVVSHAFTMQDWEPDAQDSVGGRDVYFWVVPAKVGGEWALSGPDGDLALKLDQSFQRVSGTATDATGKKLRLSGMLRGEFINLNIEDGGAGSRQYVGRVRGDTIVAQDESGAVKGWKASRR
jgi:SAM-dependent methyltransferase